MVYDNEEVIQLMRRLPLASDYKTTLRIFTGLGGGNIISLEAKVTAPGEGGGAGGHVRLLQGRAEHGAARPSGIPPMRTITSSSSKAAA